MFPLAPRILQTNYKMQYLTTPFSYTMKSSNKNISNQQNKIENLEKELTKLKQSLPKEPWFNGNPMYLYQGFWSHKLDSLVAFQTHFEALDTDIFATSCRKVGTTWLKAITFAICNRDDHEISPSHPLLSHNPHELVPQLESNIYMKSRFPNLADIKNPRIFGTHAPFQALPNSIKTKKCKIIYIFRNPLDTLISSWEFYLKVTDNQTLKPEMFELYVDMFCNGKIPFGPFEDHVLGYWNKSLESPEKVLFIKYEDLKNDPKPELKKIATFLGCSFSAAEEENGVIDDIVELCSFQKLKQVAEPHKSPNVYPSASNEIFYRKGVVGDWVNYMSQEMAEKFNRIMGEKFSGSGLMLL